MKTVKLHFIKRLPKYFHTCSFSEFIASHLFIFHMYYDQKTAGHGTASDIHSSLHTQLFREKEKVQLQQSGRFHLILRSG